MASKAGTQTVLFSASVSYLAPGSSIKINHKVPTWAAVTVKQEQWHPQRRMWLEAADLDHAGPNVPPSPPPPGPSASSP